MTILRVDSFGGLIPRINDKKLPSNCAVEAINCDLDGGAIAPFPSTRFIRSTFYSPSSINPIVPTVRQHPIVCLKISSYPQVAGYVEFDLPLGNYTIVANDELWVAVYLPSSPAIVAGQGGIALVNSVGSETGPTSADQNGLAAKTGNLSAYASDNWYLRRFSLTADAGDIISKVRFYQNHTNTEMKEAYFAFAVIRNGNAHKAVLFDTDRQQGAGTVGAVMGYHDIVQFDACDLAYTWAYTDGTIYDEQWQKDTVVYAAECQLEGDHRNRLIVAVTNGLRGAGGTVGLTNHDLLSSLKYGYSPGGKWFYNRWQAGGAAVLGWAIIRKPTAALPVPSVVGGVGPVVTRSYVYTHVSEDGFESAPSPAVTQTGNRDGSWNFVGIATWDGTDQFACTTAGSMLHKRRIYRTGEVDGVYKYVGELDDNDTAFNDAVAEANLGEDIATERYDDIPDDVNCIATWGAGIVGCVAGGTQVCFCEPYQYHAWPQDARYTVRYGALWVGAFGDRFIALTNGNPIAFNGDDPTSLRQVEILEGEPCTSPKASLATDSGIFYPGATGWLRIDYGVALNLSAALMTTDQFEAATGRDTIAMFDGKRLIWTTMGATQGYLLEPGAEDRSLMKFEVPDPIYSMGYYAPRANRWIQYESGGNLQFGKLFDDTSQYLKWTWKSKPLRTAKPVSLMVAQVESDEWDSLSNSMKYRDGFRESIPAWATGTAYEVGNFVTEGGNTYRCDIAHTAGVFATDLAALKWILTNAAYTITTTGLTQAEKWCYLKVWADADKSAEKVLVYDDFVVSDRPVVLNGGVLSDSWQFELTGNIRVSSIALAETERELREE